jgi:hypothetical protein
LNKFKKGGGAMSKRLKRTDGGVSNHVIKRLISQYGYTGDKKTARNVFREIIKRTDKNGGAFLTQQDLHKLGLENSAKEIKLFVVTTHGKITTIMQDDNKNG